MIERSRKPKFKPYDPDQLSLLPPSLDELIPDNHVVRVVRDVIDQLDIEPILNKYKGGGASSFHPKLLLKVMIYGYLSNTYSSRKIEQAVRSNIHYMWLAGMQTPDHNTINRFRNDKLKGVLKEVFAQVVTLMVDQGLMDNKTRDRDGSKLEANANKYTFVWGKSVKKYKQQIKTQIEQLWNYADTIAKEKLMDNDPTLYPELDAGQVRKTIDSINEAIKDKPVEKKIKQKLNYAKRHWPQNMAKYNEQERILGDRNSYSKTDPDATFMRMKDDHMKNGQLKPAYNWQMSTSDQYIVNYDIYHNPTDTLTLPDHLDQYKQLYGHSPDVAVGDAGYGSEQNYEYLEKHDIQAYVKYNSFHKEQKTKDKIEPKDAFRSQYLYHNPQADYFICPMGQKMTKQYDKVTKTKSGFKQIYSVYQAQNCKGCPLRGVCHKREHNRKIEINWNLKRHRNKARQKLLSEQGVVHRSQRPADVEAVFGNIKQNKHFTRFMLRGKEKVLIEAGLIALAHNLAKMAKN